MADDVAEVMMTYYEMTEINSVTADDVAEVMIPNYEMTKYLLVAW